VGGLTGDCGGWWWRPQPQPQHPLRALECNPYQPNTSLVVGWALHVVYSLLSLSLSSSSFINRLIKWHCGDGQEAQWLMKHGGFRPAGPRAPSCTSPVKIFKENQVPGAPSSKKNLNGTVFVQYVELASACASDSEWWLYSTGCQA
jgi:hypothetical protein